MVKGLVAICIPYYNKLNFLKRLIDSILIQSYSNYIVIITDDSADINAEEYIRKKDDRFIYIKNKYRMGSTANCNKAMIEAQKYFPEFIKVMHNDDYFSEENSLIKMVSELNNNPELLFTFVLSKVDVNCGESTYVIERTKDEIQAIHENKYGIIAGNIFGDPSTLLVRNCGIYMDEYLIWLVDVEWYVKLMEYNNQFSTLYEPLVTVGIDGHSVTNYCLEHKELIQREYIYLYIKHFQIQSNLIIDAIISNCIREYNGVQKTGLFIKEEYLAIIKDAVRDEKILCIYLVDDISVEIVEKVEKKLNTKIKYFCCEQGSEENYEISKKLEYLDLENFEAKNDILCFVVKKKVQDIRKKLNGNGIAAIPFISKYIFEG